MILCGSEFLELIGIMLLVVGDVPVNSEMSVVISSILRILQAQLSETLIMIEFAYMRA